MSARYRLGVDVGGTHTDLVLLDAASGALMVEKVSSTPKNPALGVLDGVARFIARGVQPDDIEFFAHGTTITTNALLDLAIVAELEVRLRPSRVARVPEVEVLALDDLA